MRTQHLRTTARLITIATVALVLAGCASSGGMAASAGPTAAAPTTAATPVAPFPTGRFQSGEMIAVMNPDGSYVGTTVAGDDWVKGNYVVTGDTIALTDSWMTDKYNDSSCVGKGAGRYRWAATAAGTSYTLIDDACAARARGLSGSGTWARVP